LRLSSRGMRWSTPDRVTLTKAAWPLGSSALPFDSRHRDVVFWLELGCVLCVRCVRAGVCDRRVRGAGSRCGVLVKP
jgi:hypothetical protein